MKILSGFAALALGLAAGATAQAAPPPLEAYGGLPSIDEVEISPDGSKLALAVSDGERRGVVVRSTTDGASHTTGAGENKIRHLDWVGSDDLVITTSQTGYIPDISGPRSEHFLGFALNVKTQRLQQLLNSVPGGPTAGTNIRTRDSGRVTASLNTLAGAPEVRTVAGVPTLFVPGVSFPSDRGVLTMFQVDLHSGAPHIVDLGDRYTTDIVLGADGLPVARGEYDVDSGRWALRLHQANGGWKEVRTVEAKLEPPSLMGLGRDGKSVLVDEIVDGEVFVREVSPDGQWSAPLAVNDVDGAIFDPESHKLIGLHVLAGDEDRYSFFDPADQKAWDMVRRAFKNDRVRLESWSRDRRKIVVLSDSPTEGQAYALVDIDAHTANWLGPRYMTLGVEAFSKVEPLRFKAKDGLELTGYLTLPRGRDPKNLPLVVFPHGGPASRDEPGFDWWAQAMASRGYAVLQVNFRGSNGFGMSFMKAGYGEWGRKMETDLSDGVRYLAAQGTIDPKRVCIVGASYGGYAALAGPTLDPGVYRCAASYAGLSDLRRFIPWARTQNGESAQRYWINFLGAESAKDPSLADVSPVAHLDKVNVPILLIHGRDDTTVPIEQSRIMADALKAAGKPVEFITLDSTDHWLSKGETRQAMLKAVVAFLEKNNPPN
jgi:dipeptidyl aminopeptidase/acylaminoacyl peptidase